MLEVLMRFWTEEWGADDWVGSGKDLSVFKEATVEEGSRVHYNSTPDIGGILVDRVWLEVV